MIVDYNPESMVPVFDCLPSATKEIMLWSGIASFIDRTGTIDLGLNIDIFTPLPSEVREVGSFADCVDRRADQIIRTGQRVNMFWSGGIDSTTALTGLIKAGIKPDQLIVNYSEASVFEYRQFFERFVNGKFPTRKLASKIMEDVTTDGLIVTGEIGDQMFGSIKTNKAFHNSPAEAKATNWKDALSFSEEVMSMFQALVDKCPFTIRNAYDFFWWINFTCKWQHVECRMANKVGLSFADYMKASCHFFNTTDFQCWTMNPENHSSKVGNEWTEYKMPAKEYIRDFTGDDAYFLNKRKVGSLPVYAARHYLMRLSTGEMISFGTNSDSPVAYRKLYGDKYNGIFKGQINAA